jgi:hypothetical protein
MDEKFDQELLTKFKAKNLAPRPRWHFWLKNYLFWGVGVLSLLVGSLSVSVVIYLVRFNDWDIYEQLDNNLTRFILLTLPYFWLVLLVILVFVCYFEISHTKKGYHYSVLIIILASIVASIILGGIFFKLGLGQYIDDVLGERAPFYRPLINPEINSWDQPEKGRLAGLVIAIISAKQFTIVDLQNQKWTITLSGEMELPTGSIMVGKSFRFLGHILPGNNFQVERILPIGPGRGIFNRHHSFGDEEIYSEFFTRPRELITM